MEKFKNLIKFDCVAFQKLFFSTNKKKKYSKWNMQIGQFKDYKENVLIWWIINLKYSIW